VSEGAGGKGGRGGRGREALTSEQVSGTGRGMLQRIFGSRRRFVVNAAVVVALVGALIVLDFRGWLEARMAYFPSREPFETPAGFEDVTFVTADGLRLHGWFMPAARAVESETSGRRPAILHVHGNAGHVGLHSEFSEFLTQSGFHIFVFDYRGFGRSEGGGRLTRQKLVRDTDAALDYLLTRDDVDPQRIGMFGYSLGGVIGLEVAAAREEVRAVAVIAAFSSWKAIARDHLGGVGAALARRGVDAEAAVAQLGPRPVLLVHGSADQIVPAAHSQRLAEVCREAGVEAQLIVVEGADHIDVMDRPQPRQAMAEFFRRTLHAADR
jgi:uncharacterized protein